MAEDTNIEYQSLRQEILDQFNREFNTISLGLTGTVAIFGYGLSQEHKSPYLFLIPLAILTATCLQLVQSHYSILRISIYIRVCIESAADEAKRWETCMHELRREESKANRFFPHTSFSILSYVTIAVVSGAVGILLGWVYVYPGWPAGGISSYVKPASITLSVATLFWGLFSWMVYRRLSLATLLKYEEGFEKNVGEWLKVRERTQSKSKGTIAK